MCVTAVIITVSTQGKKEKIKGGNFSLQTTAWREKIVEKDFIET